MILDKIKNKNGNAMILGCVVVLIVMSIFMVSGEQVRTQMTIRSTKSAIESLATMINTNNFDTIYPSQRDGVFSAHMLGNTDKWEERINQIDVSNELNKLLGVKKEGSKYVKRDSRGNIDFVLSNIKVNKVNPSIKTNPNKDTFKVEITGDLEVYNTFSIFDGENTKVKIGTKVGYTPKF